MFSDWRLTDQARYLHGVTLRWRSYRPASAAWDHDHCEFCSQRFMDADHPEVHREGYVTEDNQHWVCKRCCDDFRRLFRWTVRGAS